MTNNYMKISEYNESDYSTRMEGTKRLCKILLQTPHYKKLGEEGIFAILSTAESLGVDPKVALGGGLYYVRGKVEMSARLMNALIRSRGHSITRDNSSDDNICILHGKRSDTKDCWKESFSIEEAQRAGLTNSLVWKTYPKDMLFARALSRLARQLFPDIIGNCYVEGEISLTSDLSDKIEEDTEPYLEKISLNQIKEISLLTKELDDESFEAFLKYYNIEKIQDIGVDKFEEARKNLVAKLKKVKKEISKGVGCDEYGKSDAE